MIWQGVGALPAELWEILSAEKKSSGGSHATKDNGSTDFFKLAVMAF